MICWERRFREFSFFALYLELWNATAATAAHAPLMEDANALTASVSEHKGINAFGINESPLMGHYTHLLGDEHSGYFEGLVVACTGTETINGRELFFRHVVPHTGIGPTECGVYVPIETVTVFGYVRGKFRAGEGGCRVPVTSYDEITDPDEQKIIRSMLTRKGYLQSLRFVPFSGGTSFKLPRIH